MYHSHIDTHEEKTGTPMLRMGEKVTGEVVSRAREGGTRVFYGRHEEGEDRRQRCWFRA